MRWNHLISLQVYKILKIDSIDAIYDQLEYAEMQLNDSRKRKKAILEEKITSDNIYKILVNFNSLYTVLSDIDKKRLLNELIEEIQIYDEKTEKVLG